MKRYICIHGHFYQPPRENPWLEAIGRQISAHPYHDWNERVNIECYAPNAYARILGKGERIVSIENNYSRISFNFGPTLLSWMEEKAPDVYRAVLRADRESRERFSGHGSALAQGYNHIIMPLADRRDKITQVLWGIEDFKRRFDRMPEGMWLPETAVDMESLDIMAEQGIRFTILAPHQAKRVRPLKKGSAWLDVKENTIDTTMPYLCKLPSGRTIALFFYNGELSRAVAFDKLLVDGNKFYNRLMFGFNGGNQTAQLAHIATDGETYGHHHKFGEMALAFALKSIETTEDVALTNYGEFLDKYPPDHEVEIAENTSWSCFHGVERWRSDCGCKTGSHPEWNQKWRAPVRKAVNWLRDTLAVPFESEGKALFHDPWDARNGYISVLSDRSRKSTDAFFERYVKKPLDEKDRIKALKLLEMQRHTLLSATSCAWFFDDVSRIEPIQVMQYAKRALELHRDITGEDLEGTLLDILETAKSNDPSYGDGRKVYEIHVRPESADFQKIGAHFVMADLLEDSEDAEKEKPLPLYRFSAETENETHIRSGKSVFSHGGIRVTSTITGESRSICFAALHLGDHHTACGVCDTGNEEAHRAAIAEMMDAFEAGDHLGALKRLAEQFGPSVYTLKSLFPDVRQKIVENLLESVAVNLHRHSRRLYEEGMPLIHILKELGVPLPGPFRNAAESVVNGEIFDAFETEEKPISGKVGNLILEAERMGLAFDAEALKPAIEQRIAKAAQKASESPRDKEKIKKLAEVLETASRLPFTVRLWEVQNAVYEIKRDLFDEIKKAASRKNTDAVEWMRYFQTVADRLYIETDTEKGSIESNA